MTGSGSQTDVGTSENLPVIDWGEVNSGNYSMTDTLSGTLEVTPNTTGIKFTPDSYEKVYDGAPIFGYEHVTVTGTLPDGFTYEIENGSVIAGKGTVSNDISAVRILRDGIDVTSFFTGLAFTGLAYLWIRSQEERWKANSLLQFTLTTSSAF